MSQIFMKRLTKELLSLRTTPPPGIHIEEAEADMKNWVIKLTAVENTVYAGETFYLSFKFSEQYPLESPEVVFIRNIPVHPHVYGNGHICLSILYDNWSPALTIATVCLSILSMLSSCKKKEQPVDNDDYISTASKSPKNASWVFHDDTV